ncbi:hypothetical protein BRADI_5g19671v3 [Brachypodium distachyon]|uniref:Zinc finger GRF-type domain-containing protein n=1 Tax=Brachypodium distachyon TaxID=15368 RepID=A0A0Q3E8P9_BRADI|nr:hypothetical protein BRADI_5g19671v3 [Brachypodium distachyon]
MEHRDGSSSSRVSCSRAPVSSSPIPYREMPLDYSPVVICHCGLKAPCWISWSVLNPGRRYHTCPLRHGLQVICMSDPPTTTFLRELIGDLRDFCVKWRKENEVLKAEAADVEMQLTKMQKRIAEEENKVLSLEDEVKTMRKELQN